MSSGMGNRESTALDWRECGLRNAAGSGGEDNAKAKSRQFARVVRDGFTASIPDFRFAIPESVDTPSKRAIAYDSRQVNYFTKSGA